MAVKLGHEYRLLESEQLFSNYLTRNHVIATRISRILIRLLRSTSPCSRSVDVTLMRALQRYHIPLVSSRRTIVYTTAWTALHPASRRPDCTTPLPRHPGFCSLQEAIQARFHSRPAFAVMGEPNSRKQATLGYVRDSQLTIGCV